MNIVCVICSDLLIPADDVFYTPCGHIFHFVCLTQWLERSKSCPQCREKTTESRIHRIYFNFSNNDTITEDASCLQDRIDKLKFQILMKDSEIKQFSEKNTSLERQNAGLRREVRAAEAQLAEKSSAIYALKEQTKHFKQQSLEIESARKEIARLKKRIEEYRNVQILLEAPSEDVDSMISRTTDPNTLITYISVMKREMSSSLTKRRELRNRAKGLQQELTKVSMERNFLNDEAEKRKKLEIELIKCENEKMSLYNEITELRKKTNKNCTNCSISKCDKWLDDCGSSINDKSKESSEKKLPKEKPRVIEERIITSTPMKENGENSPYLPVKAQGVFALNGQVSKRRAGVTLGPSILSKKPRIEQAAGRSSSSSMLTYDGFGGHSKHDYFPSPHNSDKLKRTKTDPIVIKKSRSDVGRNQKLSSFVVSSSDNKGHTSKVVLD